MDPGPAESETSERAPKRTDAVSARLWLEYRSMTDGYVQGAPRSLLRMEGAALLLSALVGYWWAGQPWWLLAALVLAPDLSMLGYLAGSKVGAAIYNAAHSTIAPLLLLSGSALLDDRMTLGLALIWLAHIGFDRALGYGLKYVSGFGDTHLGSLRRSS